MTGIRPTARIGIDARLAAYRGGGIPEHVRRLLRGLAALSPPEEVVVLEHRRARTGAPSDIPDPFRRRYLFTPPHHRLESIALPVELASLRLDLFHATDMVVPAWWRGRSVVTIHDLAFVDDPTLLTAAATAYYRGVFETVRRAQRIITVSQHTRSQLLAHTDADPARVRVIYNAILPEFGAPPDVAEADAALERFGLTETPYFLFVGTIEPRKNVMTLLDAYARFPVDSTRPSLVLAGADGWLSESVYERAASAPGDIRFLGYVAQPDLIALMRGALALVHPALDEGFGMTVAEAMACATPVIASASGSLPEVTAGAAYLVPPAEPAAWANALARVAADRALRADLVEKGLARARHFSLEAMATATLDVYRDALQ